jgi:hypothetical protein
MDTVSDLPESIAPLVVATIKGPYIVDGFGFFVVVRRDSKAIFNGLDCISSNIS